MEHFLFETFWGGITFLFLGVVAIICTIKYIEKDYETILQGYISGILAGIGFIIAGLAILYTTLFG